MGNWPNAKALHVGPLLVCSAQARRRKANWTSTGTVLGGNRIAKQTAIGASSGCGLLLTLPMPSNARCTPAYCGQPAQSRRPNESSPRQRELAKLTSPLRQAVRRKLSTFPAARSHRRSDVRSARSGRRNVPCRSHDALAAPALGARTGLAALELPDRCELRGAWGDEPAGGPPWMPTLTTGCVRSFVSPAEKLGTALALRTQLDMPPI